MKKLESSNSINLDKILVDNWPDLCPNCHSIVVKYHRWITDGVESTEKYDTQKFEYKEVDVSYEINDSAGWSWYCEKCEKMFHFLPETERAMVAVDLATDAELKHHKKWATEAILNDRGQ